VGEAKANGENLFSLLSVKHMKSNMYLFLSEMSMRDLQYGIRRKWITIQGQPGYCCFC
jgi:hypothetical protein